MEQKEQKAKGFYHINIIFMVNILHFLFHCLISF